VAAAASTTLKDTATAAQRQQQRPCADGNGGVGRGQG
jgi:hypothetical protein